jgi:hAT family C-terminal dimerisation region
MSGAIVGLHYYETWRKMTTHKCKQNMNELVSYCLGSMEPDGIDILDYWKMNETAYPTLAMMARDIFAVPVSTVPSESCFSLANKILTDKHSRLGVKTFERLICLKD